jgi:hypothetical protein
MSEDREKRVGGCAAAFPVAALLALLMSAYVLSAGPAILFFSNETWAIAYFPLLTLSACLPPFGTVLELYLRFFVSISETASG